MGVHSPTTGVFFFFFSSEFHPQLEKKKEGGRTITFVSHMSLKSVLGVSSFTKKKPPFIYLFFCFS